ncbi:replication-relaxation family protein [Paenibacillus athensensis]|uniref:Uncharacterized protein n=1 Tax=Paenibacillus athensensis TaxID=1967502 RepID=A0A4Y8PYM1_9BACL|nr:replication-relaxation family protein [Paenibacillus athensensis]MCD1261285.1 replication-relaxation family protein [Paenibacillus athensensis]
MYYAAKKEMLTALYRYTLLTAQQLATLLHYQVPTIYGMVCEMKEQGLVRSIPLPFLRKNHVGYFLTAYGARAAASLVGEEEVFRAKAWEDDPVQLEHFYGTNAFFILLIRHSLACSGEGLLEWQSNREAAEQYAHFKESGQKTLLLRPDGMASYLLPERGKLVFHVEYDTGSENLWKLQDKLWLYGRVLPSVWATVESVQVLFVTQIDSRPKRLLELWSALCVEGPLLGRKIPNVWAISETEWKQHGVADAKWLGANGERIALKDMPLLPLPPEANLPLLGKQPREASPMRKR